jgi:hypothetical protein
MFAKFIANTALVAASIVLSILVMIHGWGLQPRSWGWIIGIGFGVQVVVLICRDLVNKKGDE